LPADTKNKKPLVSWYEWQDKPIPEQLHSQWKEQGSFSEGIAIVPGKIWHNVAKKDLYFVFIDTDTQKAIDELCTISSNITSLQELSKKFLVEQHKDNPQKAHIYFYSPIPFPKKNADSTIGLEVKGLGEHGIAFCFPSTHKDGMPYEIIGTNQPVTLTIDQARELMQHINQICIKYGLEYLERQPSSSNSSTKMQCYQEFSYRFYIKGTTR
jgi:putative DNA primase/helicase